MVRAVVIVLFAVPFYTVWAQTAPDLGTAADFAVLASTTVTCTTATINGDVGVNLGGSVGACTVNGTIHTGDALAVQAYGDFRTAYAALSAVSCSTIQNGTLAGLTLAPGVYCLDASAKTGLLTLTGPPDGIWIFKTESSGLTATSFDVVFSGGVPVCTGGARVSWWSSAAATLTTSAFMGTLLAGTDITVTDGSIHGRALATGAVTLTRPSVSWLALQPATLPSGWLFNAYSQTIMASGGTGPYTYSIASGSLPANLTMDTLTGAISGTPTVTGSYTFVVCALDFNGFTGSRSYSIVVTDPTPAGVFASSNASIKKGKVTATWQSNVETGVAQYQVHISKRADTGFAPVDSTVTAPKGNNSSYLVTFPLPQRLMNAKRIYVVVQDLDMDGQTFWSTVSAIQRKVAGKTPKGKLLFIE